MIAADTVINASPRHCDILNKPKHADQAEMMLTALSGKEHQVLTGVHIIFSDKSWHGHYREQHFVEGTMVKFAKIDPGLMKACKCVCVCVRVYGNQNIIILTLPGYRHRIG